MIKQIKRWMLMVVLTASLTPMIAGCGNIPSGAPPVQAGYVGSNLSRDTATDVPAGDMSTQVQGNTAFALDLYHQLITGDSGNLFYSPYSISLALAMTFAGAEGNTEAQMSQVMHYDLPEAELHAALNHLDQVLAMRREAAEGADGGGFRLNVANAIWGQSGYEFQETFLDTLAVNYGAGLRLVDYINETEKARQVINSWVSEQTEDRIRDLIPPGTLDILTRLVLTNAIYFNAAWAEAFDENDTANADFTLLDGAKVTVPMMSHKMHYGFASGDGYQIVELAYDGHELAMDIILPNEGAFEDFESTLTCENLSAMLAKVQMQEIILEMPKFEIESEFSLNDALVKLGMSEAFDPDIADFSGINGKRELFISDVIHKSFVKVDEAGTEAAAAAAVVMKTLSAGLENPPTVTIDHPFIFVIRDLETGAILFVGRIVNPTE